MASKKTATMKDVAKEAGVALGTVSKMINGLPVSEEKRRKIEAAIKSLNYEVNTYAQGLRAQKSNLVALIIPNTNNPFFSSFTNQVEYALYKRGKKLLLCCAGGIAQKEIEYLNMAINNKVDGIIALTYSDIGNYISQDIPLVVFDRYFENRDLPRVASDNFAGACLAVEKLLEFGCRHPVYIRFYSFLPGEADKRKDGYLYACAKHHLEPDFIDVENSKNNIAVMKDFIEKHKNKDGTLSFDGVFAHTDYYGYIFQKLLRQEGFRVPEDVQIIGFDGINIFGNADDGLFISSICQPVDALAEKCVEILLSGNSSLTPSLTLLPVQYRGGGTTLE